MTRLARVLSLVVVAGCVLGSGMFGSSQDTQPKGGDAQPKGGKGAAGDAGAVTVPVADAFRSATWTLIYRWEGSGEGRTQITFKDDGTFVTGDGKSGRWFQIGRQAVFAFAASGSLPAWSSVYSTTVNENGTGFSGIQGWSHTSGNPKGIHVGSRSTRFIEDVKQLEHSGAPVTGEPAK